MDLAEIPSREPEVPPFNPAKGIVRLGNVAVENPNAEAILISCLTLDDFHDLWLRPWMTQYVRLAISTRAALSPGSIIFHSSAQPTAFFEIAKFPDCNIKRGNWVHNGRRWHQAHGDVMGDSWIRYFLLPTEFNL